MSHVDKPLTDCDVIAALKSRGRPYKYKDLPNLDVESLLKSDGYVAFTYPATSDYSGHWVAILYTLDNNGKLVVEFFDPYGLSPDREFRFTNIKYNNKVSNILTKTNLPVTFNGYQLQEFGVHVTTCGRHVVNRIRHRYMPLDDYAYQLLKTGDPDKYVLSLNL